mgnify:CR=1 FL=1
MVVWFGWFDYIINRENVVRRQERDIGNKEIMEKLACCFVVVLGDESLLRARFASILYFSTCCVLTLAACLFGTSR